MEDDPIISEALAIMRERYGDEIISEVLRKELQRMSSEMIEKAKAMRVPPEVQGVCPHSMVGKEEDDTYWCVDCGQQVYPDPDWFEKGFLIYGGQRMTDQLPPYRHTAERLQELEAKVVELQEANEAQKRVNRSYMERIFTLEGQNQKLQDEQRQQLDRIASLERSLAEHRDWHVGVEQRISEQRAGIVRRKKLSATREDTTS